MNKHGRNSKPRRFTPDEIKRLRTYGALRMPFKQMAALLNTDADYLVELMKQQPEARNAYDEGRAEASQKVRGTLFQRATGVKKPDGTWDVEPSMLALKFWCETQEGFKREEKIEIVGLDGGPVAIASMTPEQRAAEIEKLILKRKQSLDE